MHLICSPYDWILVLCLLQSRKVKTDDVIFGDWMKLSDFDYHLPKQMIAQRPADPRDSSRLMVLDGTRISHLTFHDLPRLLQPGDLLVMNNSRVIPASIFGKKETGGKVEVLLVRRLEDKYYECLVKGRVKTGVSLQFDSGVSGMVVERVDSHTGYRYNIRFRCEGAFESRLQDIGVMPVPPYIKEQPGDGERYQTVYSRQEGSIAAPTAGLHFTPGLLSTLEDRGVSAAFITLHVGVGTFMPVRAENVEEHMMEAEYFTIGADAANSINEAIANNNRIIVVGTTTVRSLESAQWKDGKIEPSQGWAQCFIYPPYDFKTPMNGLVTNFHLPKSTLLMLVSAFAGRERVMNAYIDAVNTGYRFYSFGDAMLVMNGQGEHNV